MTDNRQFTDGTTIGGVDVYYEDKKLAESTSTTTMTTEGVLLKGTDGAFYEIDKTSLSDVIRAELGNILADNSKDNGTSVGKVPTLNSTGNALGASSIADLASVLDNIDNKVTVAIERSETKIIGRINYGTMFLLRVGSWCELYYFNDSLDRLSANLQASSRVTPSIDNDYNLVLTNNASSSYYVDIIWLRKR